VSICEIIGAKRLTNNTKDQSNVALVFLK